MWQPQPSELEMKGLLWQYKPEGNITLAVFYEDVNLILMGVILLLQSYGDIDLILMEVILL